MIFVTVGSELPFDRMVRTIDAWAAQQGRTDVFAQIGPTDWQPSSIQWVRFLDSAEFARHLAAADLVVSHAGMGTILSALHRGKPLLVMPRRGALRETRNDHQVATAQRFSEAGRVQVAYDEAQLRDQLDRLAGFGRPEPIGPFASEQLLSSIRAFVAQC